MSSDTGDFREATRRDAQIAMSKELDRLTLTCPDHMQKQVRSDLDGYERIFKRFLSETGPSVRWDKINLLPKEAVSKPLKLL